MPLVKWYYLLKICVCVNALSAPIHISFQQIGLNSAVRLGTGHKNK